jgi:assimilatory nitrate reductase catalytic subunit
MSSPAPNATVRTTCPYCGVGCGVMATPDGAGGAEIRGDLRHPANQGRLCSKGSALGETLGLETRLLYPEISGKRASWGAALDHVAAEFVRIRQKHGPEAIAFYLSGQLLTEDYYVANKLAKGFLGTPHVDTNSRLCMASTVAGHRRAFGGDVVPQCYDDLELADTVVLVGSNAAWCHPILYQRLQVARAERGLRVVNIDPRRTATAEGADLQLSIRPGSDATLWNGLLVWLADAGLIDWRYVTDHTKGFGKALAEARELAGSLASVALDTGLNGTDIEKFYEWWAETPRVVTCFSQGVNQSAQGTAKVNAIVNCHLATGRIGKEGSGPLSLTGQPNAMGGREVGGLANMLAAHMGYTPENIDRVRRFWDASQMATGDGLKAVGMFEAIARGEIKALWVMGTNPAVSLPRADAVRDALGKLELLVVSENVASNDTIRHANVRLPAHAWGEKDGTVTNSERRISRQRPFAAAAGEAKPDWWALSQLAKRFGWGRAFAYETPAEIFREHARLSAFENDGSRVFNLAGLADLTNAEYDGLQPIQWPVLEKSEGTARLFADGRFPTPSGRAAILPVGAAQCAATPGADFPFVLNTGRVRDQWHTMTRTGLSPRLATSIAEPFVEMHADDAARLGLEQGGLALVETEHGRATLRVLVADGAHPGSLFVPIHWSGENSSQARICALVQPATDPFSGQPESKATPARISAVAVSHYGVLLSREPAAMPNARYWARARFADGFATYLALDAPAEGWAAFAEGIANGAERLSFADEHCGIFRAATLSGGRVESVLFLAPQPVLPSLDWLKSCFALAEVPPESRRGLLAGRPVSGGGDDGPIICVCHNVGARSIDRAIADGADTAEAIGAACKAGTNCGSCVPELKRTLAKQRRAVSDAAE